jgi:hypothetical protein
MKLRIIGPNQTEVEVDGVCVFFSYNTPVAAQVGRNYFRTEVKHSATTSKHVNTWLAGKPAVGKPQEFFEGLLVAGKGGAS